MVQISCQRCLKVFKYNYLLEKHLKCKRKCKEIQTNTLEETTNKLNEVTEKLEKLIILQEKIPDDEPIIC